MTSTGVYTWPERGDVEYFVSKFVPTGADGRLVDYYTTGADGRLVDYYTTGTDGRLLSGKETQHQTQQ